MGEIQKQLPDSSDWYDPERAIQEDVNWLLSGHYRNNIAFILPRMTEAGVTSVIDFGCGSGLVATGLPPKIDYLGVEKNEFFLEMARRRNRDRDFTCWCVRNYEGKVRDLATAFGLLKHFRIDEWHAILGQVLKHGRYACFDVQLREKEMDDGEVFHHTYVSEARLKNALEVAGHEEVERQVGEQWSAGGQPAWNVLIWTRAKKKAEELTLEQATRDVMEDVKHALTKMNDSSAKTGRVSYGVDIPQSVPLPHMNTQYIEIGGKVAVDLRDYSIRWHGHSGKEEPALYFQGKRVIAPWHMKLDVVVAKDEKGASA